MEISNIFFDSIFIILFSTGIIVWIIALYVKNHQPSKPNKIYGYRTKRSMRTQESWDFSQEYSINLLIRAAQFLCLLGVLSYYIKLNIAEKSIIAVTIVIVVLLIPVYLTEKKLKEKFGDK